MDNYEMDTREKFLFFSLNFSTPTLSLHSQFPYPTSTLHQPYTKCFLDFMDDNF
ncbi:hypothetical protein IGK01_001180 [Enterococcus sp. AZ080]